MVTGHFYDPLKHATTWTNSKSHFQWKSQWYSVIISYILSMNHQQTLILSSAECNIISKHMRMHTNIPWQQIFLDKLYKYVCTLNVYATHMIPVIMLYCPQEFNKIKIKTSMCSCALRMQCKKHKHSKMLSMLSWYHVKSMLPWQIIWYMMCDICKLVLYWL